MHPTKLFAPGPFQAQQLRSGDPYELSNGHPILCLPTGGRGARANLLGGTVLETDPAVEQAGVDAGFSPEPGTMRAPDVAVGHVPDVPGWVQGAPPLAVEYADRGQDEEELQSKIAELLAAGTQYVWVVWLTGPRRVEVYAPGQKLRTVRPGESLEAPGILKNPVPVEALYDREAAHEATLRNLLQRRGYESLEAVRDAGREAGELAHARAVLRRQLGKRGISLDAAQEARIDGTTDLETLDRWLDQTLVAKTVDEALR
ncbi:Uma2 family endonuclease [Polyangium jinanense]|uniref:Uma2 family endonuclease n=1 Tax=Polyangium jinanense TaxID=2829994 RepID=A0A9X4AX99_9BACT|nr:Uma2 family endonuclease [Polyangium jinanense]MDC3958387.1 Uma2 family endonuclease [Polyangium jinanense]MDC3988283.1 Uma2 family endonuclease [Polyangium jinanense]